MENGCNEMVNNNIRKFDGMMPPVVDEMYQLLTEMDEDFDWNDCLYTDADKSCSVLKHNSTVELYFKKAYDNYARKHEKFPDIGSFFSEPSKEDFFCFLPQRGNPGGDCRKMREIGKRRKRSQPFGRCGAW